jgi:prophage regulatory protein
MNKQSTTSFDDSGSLLKLKEVMQKTSLGQSYIYKSMYLGTFPKQLKISKRCVRWYKSEIQQWIEDQKIHQAR